MCFVIFVAGLLPFDSGKTSFSADIIRYFENKVSTQTIPFKPLSGNNLYYHYAEHKDFIDTYGTVVSLDVMELLAESSVENLSPVYVNPVHQINTPAFAYKFMEEQTIHTYYERFTESPTLIQRFSILEQTSKIRTVFLVNEQTYNNPKFMNDKELIEPIIEKADKVIKFKNEHEYYTFNAQYYADATNSMFEHLKDKYPVVVIESFNNSAHPAWCVRDADAIFIVGPGSVLVYEAQNYLRAIDNYHSLNPDKPSTTEEIVKLAKPIRVYPLSASSSARTKEIEKIVKVSYAEYKKK